MKSQKRKTRNPRMASKATRRSPTKGVVVSRKCSSCEHHEIGVISRTGKFLSLKPGMKIAILQGEKKD